MGCSADGTRPIGVAIWCDACAMWEVDVVLGDGDLARVPMPNILRSDPAEAHHMGRVVAARGATCRTKRSCVRAERLQALPPRRSDGWIYAIRAGASGPVKFGWARDIGERLRKFQTAHFVTLTVAGFGPGTRHDEAQLHQRLAAERIRGEWYRASNTTLAAVAALATPRDPF